jgi:hypothetical protein
MLQLMDLVSAKAMYLLSLRTESQISIALKHA